MQIYYTLLHHSPAFFTTCRYPSIGPLSVCLHAQCPIELHHACMSEIQIAGPHSTPPFGLFPSSAFNLQPSTIILILRIRHHTNSHRHQLSTYSNRTPISHTWVTRTSKKAYLGSFILPQTLILSITPPETLLPANPTRSQRNLTTQHYPHPLLVAPGVY